MSNSKKAAIISLVAETHIHAGIGQSTGALDLPVARERTTDFPFVPGSGVKGAFRVWAAERAALGDDMVIKLFGPPSDDDGSDRQAGKLLCSDARLLLLPVRCMSDAYKWVTCPTILNRLKRDCERAQSEAIQWAAPQVDNPDFLGQKPGDSDEGWLGLEEREFKWKAPVAPEIVQAITNMVGTELGHFIDERLVILSDRDFSWFARFALPVMARNALDENKAVKTGALWHEESLAPDTIMYALFGEREAGAVKSLTDAIQDAPYIQMGGNETLGQGWFRMSALEGIAP